MNLLVELGGRGLAVLLIGIAAVAACGRAAPATRHAILATSFFVLLALPLQTAFGPRWHPAIATPQSARIAADTDEFVAMLRQAAEVEPVRGAGAATSIPQGAAEGRPDFAGFVVVFYVAGVLFLLVRRAVGTRRVAQLVARSRPLTASDSIWERVQRTRPGTPTTPVRCVESGECGLPFVTGVFRPVVVLPLDFRSWDPEVADLVLQHELAHVARRDVLVRAMADLACAVHWFDPLAWFAARHLRGLGELACDARVLASGAREDRYAEMLVDLARRQQAGRFLQPALAAGARSDLGLRIEALLSHRSLRVPARCATACAALTVALLHGIAAACMPARAPRAPQGTPHSTLNWSDGGMDISTNAAGLQSRWYEEGRHAGLFASGDIGLAGTGEAQTGTGPGMLLVLEETSAGLRVFEAHDRIEGLPDWARTVLHRGAARIEALHLTHGTSATPQAQTPTPPPSPTAKGTERGSSSTLIGLPAVSDDPHERVVQAGWLQDGLRHGVFERGTWRVRGGRLESMDPNAWLCLFSFDPVTGTLQRLTATRTTGAATAVECAVDGAPAPIDAARIDWAAGLLRTLANVSSSETE